jgi:glycosyltransferase involved in cell wall biosynthesis
MRLLLSAIACHPHWGSEGHVGWAVVNALSAKHNLTVLTHSQSIGDIQSAVRNNPTLSRVRFIGIGQVVTWHQNRTLARLQSWRQYATWCREAHKIASELVASEEYDLGHHVTYSTWRQISPLSNLGIPWVLGPVGGGESFPTAFSGCLSLQSRLFEMAREASSRLAMRSAKLRRSIRSASFVLASTPETVTLVRRMGVAPERTALVPAIFLHADRIKLFKSCRPKHHSPHLRIFAGGSLEGRKGVALALRALAALVSRGVAFKFTFAGSGPELSHLETQAAALSLDPSRILFRDSLPLDQYIQTLQNSDVYLLPSLRDSGGLTLGEAMLAGCVPIVIRAGGPGLLVTPDCGYAFEPDSPEHVVEQMTNALQTLSTNEGHRLRLSANAVTHAEIVLSEDCYLASVENAYRACVKD